MPRKYERKSSRRSWNEDALIAAIEEIRSGRSCYSVAIQYDTPEATLRRYIKRLDRGEDIPCHGGKFHNTFNEDQSKLLLEYVRDMDKRGFGLTGINLRKLAYEFAEENHIQHRFSRTTQMAGKDWLSSFMSKFKLSLRTPEATATGRLMGFNRVSVTKFFNNLREIRLKHIFPPNRIYNADESGISTVPNKLPKTLSPTGNRRVSKVVCAERGKNTTVCCAMSATGQFIPPFFVFGRIRMREELLHGTPPGSDGAAQKNGWMTGEIFLKYLHHFAKHAKPSKEEPVLLIVDNHSSHITLEGINFCRENGIVMLGLPPHTSHRLQPLDVGFFGPLKTYMSQACDSYVVNNPGKSINDKNIGHTFCEAYLKAASVGTGVKAFQKCGIEPYDPSVFTDDDFAPAETTNREFPPQEAISRSDDESSNDDQPLANLRSSKCLSTATEKRPISHTSTVSIPTKECPVSHTSKVSTPTKERSIWHTSTHSTPTKERPISHISEPPATTAKSKVCPLNENFPQASCSYTVSPYTIRPLPKAERSEKRSKRKMVSSVLTSTPIKLQLEERLHESKQKEAKKRKVPAPKELTSTTSKGKPLSGANSRMANSVENISCPGCEEVYTDPPSEEWIQCSSCSNWWHEACTAYSGAGAFICDLC